MNPETPFLEAIKADPRDTATRLVYADWLEERGDPRAELIRIEEEMRPLPVFSDRFWQLKPRRWELLRKLPKDWLETMRYGTDCPPTFRHQPTGWNEWWRLIRVFSERWHHFPSLPDIGGQPAALSAIEENLGRPMPASLREWVAFANDLNTHRFPNFFCTVDLPQMTRASNHDSLVCILESREGKYYRAVHHADFALPDPPIHGFDAEADAEFIRQWRLYPTVSSYVLQWACCACVEGAGGGFYARPEEGRESLKLLSQLYADFPVHFEIECESARNRTTHHIFESENVLVFFHQSQVVAPIVRVEVYKNMPHEAIPQYLWKLAKSWIGKASHGDDGNLRGVFLSLSYPM
jgi:uncharacterized protein (TIGR02996 family)